MTRHDFVVVAALVAIFSMVTADQTVAQTTVTGSAFQVTNTGAYVPLPGAEVVAFREGPVLEKPSVTDDQGRFWLAIRPGEPFTVVFYGEDKVPELQQIAALDRVVNQVNVALLTPEQYERLHKGSPPLADRLKCIEQELPKADVPELQRVRKLIQRLRGSLRSSR